MSIIKKKENNLNQLIGKLNSLTLTYSQPTYEVEKIKTEKNEILRQKIQIEKKNQELLREHKFLKEKINNLKLEIKKRSEIEDNFNQEIEELSQDTENLVSEIEKSKASEERYAKWYRENTTNPSEEFLKGRKIKYSQFERLVYDRTVVRVIFHKFWWESGLN